MHLSACELGALILFMSREPREAGRPTKKGKTGIELFWAPDQSVNQG